MIKPTYNLLMTDAEIRTIFSGKKITLMGLGLLGRGAGDAAFLAGAGAELIVTDMKTEAELAPSLERLKRFPNIVYHLGGHHLEDFENRDMIIRAPNAPLDSPFLAHARKNGIPIEMDASLFAKLSGAMIVGITGTRGKSTVTHFIYAIAQAAGKNPRIGGNERDTATLTLLPETQPDDLVILELDSWQLQGFMESKISPHISVWTNFMRDHMNYYKNDMDRYFEDKAAIARFQKPGDFFITRSDIKGKIETRFGPLAAKTILNPELPADWKVGIPGGHNRANAAFARAAARCLNVSDEVIRPAIESFAGLPGRLEFLGEKNGIEFYNDSNSTTPDAAIAAIAALAPKHKPIILIAGGSDKELQFESLAKEIAASVHAAVFFKGSATEKLTPLLPKDFSSKTVAHMPDAVTAALGFANPGSIILLSPAATSFGIFANEYDRGDQFRAIVQRLK